MNAGNVKKQILMQNDSFLRKKNQVTFGLKASTTSFQDRKN